MYNEFAKQFSKKLIDIAFGQKAGSFDPNFGAPSTEESDNFSAAQGVTVFLKIAEGQDLFDLTENNLRRQN